MARPERVEAVVSEAGDRGHGALCTSGSSWPNQPCRQCDHKHRITERHQSGAHLPELTWDATCSCGCLANGSNYDDYGTIYTRYLYNHHYGTSSSTTGTSSNAGGVRSVEPGGGVRGGRMGWLLGAGVSGFPGDLINQLVGQRGNE